MSSKSRRRAEAQEKLANALNDLAKGLGPNGDIVTAIKDSAEKKIKKADVGEKRQTKDINAQLHQIAFFSKLSAMTLSEVNRSIKQSLTYQKTALGRGLNLQKILAETGPRQKQFGDKTGFGAALDISMAMWDSGMRTNNKAMNELALYTKITGGNEKKLLTQIAKMTVGMNLSKEQQTSLGETMKHLSQTYGLTTDELAGAMEAMGDNMRTFKLLGVGADVTEAGMAIGAAMGKAGAPFGAQFLSQMLSADGLITATMLGVNKERLAILNDEGDAVQNSIRLVAKAGAMADQRLKALTAGGMDRAVAIKMLDKTMGKGFGDAALIWRNIKDQADITGVSTEKQLEMSVKRMQQEKDWTATWDNFKTVVWSPLSQKLTELVAWITKLYTKFPELFTWIGYAVIALGTVAAALTATKFIGMLTGLSLLPKVLGAAAGAGNLAGAGAMAPGLASLGGAASILAGGAAGAVAILALSHAIDPLADGLIKMDKVGGPAIAAMAGALGVLGATVLGLGKAIGKGGLIGKGAFLLGLTALAGIVTSVLLPATLAIKFAGDELEALSSILKIISEGGVITKVDNLATSLFSIGSALESIGTDAAQLGVDSLQNLGQLIGGTRNTALADSQNSLAVATVAVGAAVQQLGVDQEGRWNAFQRQLSVLESAITRAAGGGL